MKLISRHFISLLSVFFVTASVADEVLPFRAGPLSIDLPSTWHFKSVKGSIEGKGPNDELAIFSVMSIKPDSPQAVRDNHMRAVRGFAKDGMPGLASKNGEVLRPVTEAELPEGRVLFSAATKTTRLFREGFFLQYYFASKSSMVYLTIEGKGSATDATKYFDEVVSNHKWTE